MSVSIAKFVKAETTDCRTKTPVWYLQLSINEYLDLVGDDFDRFELQRRREKSGAYDRMKADLVKGTLLPAITLSCTPQISSLLLNDRSHSLGGVHEFHILDGLQRTYILHDLKREGHVFHPEHKVLVELWLGTEMRDLLYRIIVLNAGQKPMSLRHQIEILFATFSKELEKAIKDLAIHTERDGSRRRNPGQYPLSRIAVAYNCFLVQSPEPQKENIVAQKLVEDRILDENGEEMLRQFDLFREYMARYVQIDQEICRIYPSVGSSESSLSPSANNGSEVPLPLSGIRFFGEENFLNSIFAAIGSLCLDGSGRKTSVDAALDRLLQMLRDAPTGSDPLEYTDLRNIVGGFNVRKVNVGQATRRLLTDTFEDYLRNDGERPIKACLTRAAK